MFFNFKDILQHFKFVNWRIGEFVFWCHEQVIYSIADSIRDIQRLESGDNKPGENTWKILNENMQDLKDMLSAETKFRVKTRLLAKGSFFNYTDNSSSIIDHLPG